MLIPNLIKFASECHHKILNYATYVVVHVINIVAFIIFAKIS